MRLLDQVTVTYGSTLVEASEPELISLLAVVSLELEQRSKHQPRDSQIEHIHRLAEDATQEDLLTLGIAAGIRLRCPNVADIFSAIV
jgi:hypothetical protein